MELFVLAALLGFIPAMIAKSKGRSFGAWWLYGFLLFIIALIHSLIIRPNKAVIEQIQLNEGMKKCPFCAEMIKSEAIKCKHCGSDVQLNNYSNSNAVIPVSDLQNLRKAENYRYYDFIDKDSKLVIQNIHEFCTICLSYINEVRRNGGLVGIAEDRVVSMINEISAGLNESNSKEFESLCEKKLINH